MEHSPPERSLGPLPLDAVGQRDPRPAPSQVQASLIRRAILRLATGRVRDLRVEVRDETIVLSGRCRSYYCKQLAQHAAMEMAQGQRVYNQIEVE